LSSPSAHISLTHRITTLALPGLTSSMECVDESSTVTMSTAWPLRSRRIWWIGGVGGVERRGEEEEGKEAGRRAAEACKSWASLGGLTVSQPCPGTRLVKSKEVYF
jgi:hypothetical protein